ncbi:DUF86 domain-containing protein [Beijerinckia sp. L45]|uniref:HepT-like ribonuclease domain-containing protein n=1 Tax=Beijerinckia sp. L45 TaxID=1641855 RepID=UPI00210F8A37|nr:HepT-like ribonuclease domain-containing protein [Beijerinckia sp. L45]
MRHNIALAFSFVDGLSYEQFCDAFKSFYAVTRALETISEASRKLSSDLKARQSTIPWKEMAAAGNIYRHEYEDVIQRRVWQTVFEALPLTLEAVESELEVDDPPSEQAT